MRISQVRLRLAALLVTALMTQPAALGQSVPAAATSSSQTQFPQLPLKRDPALDAPTAQSLGWTALLLAAAAAAAFVVIRRKRWAGKGPGAAWLRSAVKPGTPKLLGRTLLAPQSSLHVVEWNGEELLLGCTPHAVSLLGRRSIDPGPDEPGSGAIGAKE